MSSGKRIEEIRQELKIPVYIMCNMLNIDSEIEYDQIIKGHKKLTNRQKIMIVSETHKILN